MKSQIKLATREGEKKKSDNLINQGWDTYIPRTLGNAGQLAWKESGQARMEEPAAQEQQGRIQKAERRL